MIGFLTLARAPEFAQHQMHFSIIRRTPHSFEGSYPSIGVTVYVSHDDKMTKMWLFVFHYALLPLLKVYLPSSLWFSYVLLFVRPLPGRQRFSPRPCHSYKIVLDISLLNTQHYKVLIKGKVERSGGRSSALPYTSV